VLEELCVVVKNQACLSSVITPKTTTQVFGKLSAHRPGDQAAKASYETRVERPHSDAQC
jgi:hypothetical protein